MEELNTNKQARKQFNRSADIYEANTNRITIQTKLLWLRLLTINFVFKSYQVTFVGLSSVYAFLLL